MGGVLPTNQDSTLPLNPREEVLYVPGNREVSGWPSDYLKSSFSLLPERMIDMIRSSSINRMK
jgi:hypothetical protein